LLFYLAEQFPSRYRGGALIAFHGSWNRAPFPQQGYNVVFQPFEQGKPTGSFEIFADGFAGAVKEPGAAAHRPCGLAVGPGGALYISDDRRGTIWRVVYDASNPTRRCTLWNRARLPHPTRATFPGLRREFIRRQVRIRLVRPRLFHHFPPTPLR